MIKRISAIAVLLFIGLVLCAQEKVLTKGMKITKTTKVKRASYLLPSADLETPVIIVEGNNIIVDFNNALLAGSASSTEPDEFSGVAVLIRNSRKVTIRNLKAKGYKIALRAINVEDLIIENSDLSYNYRKKLNSTQEKEDISDWMSYHHNDKDEWLRYGAAIYLRDCDRATIRNTRVTGGQNALMMTGSDNGLFYNNDFSFNSGIGIGLYRSGQNKFLYNRVNFNVRGYSHGVYRRGQDSAGFLVYEQSHSNIFYKNSATHSGDGFFLWAGQTTMDTGEGGCNDNFIMENDFSYAPTNGIEVTFSRNIIMGNRIFDCDHGIWGGYSFNTIIRNNQFRQNRIGIAIEHGQDNMILYNLFSADEKAIRLWARNSQPADWGYAKKRDTRSRNYLVASNSFNRNAIVYDIKNTRGVALLDNTVSGAATEFMIDSTVTAIDSTGNDELTAQAQAMGTELPKLPAINKPLDPFLGNGRYRGRQNILITEWGPYDFRYPIIWNINPTDSSEEMKFVLLGPAGKWKIKNSKGVGSISKSSGSFPDTIRARKLKADRIDISIDVEYTGPAFTDVYGQSILTKKPHLFSYQKYFQPIEWKILWYSMDTAAHNPITTGQLFSPVERKRPVKEEANTKLDYAWWGGIRAEGETFPQFFTVADGEAEFENGEYELSITWDDAVRIYLDGELVLNEWEPSRYSFDESPNRKLRLKLGGRHVWRVEHVELGGFACLSLKLRKLR